MSEFRTEVNIPVTRDSRTFEQRRKDMLTNLERRTSNRRSGGHSTSGVHSNTSDFSGASTLPSDSAFGGSHIRTRDDWDEEVDRWISESRKRWNEEMKRMREEMFALEPMDDFGLDSWHGDLKPFEPIGDHSSMMQKMEREMQALREQMNSMSPLGPSSRMPLTGGSTVKSSSSRITSSTSTSSSGDPRNMKTKSNVQESVEHSRTVNGVTTGTSSHSKMSTSSLGPGKPDLLSLSAAKPGALLEPASPTGNNFLNNAYELDEDGQVHFKVRFNAKDFSPEDIDVTTVNNKLTVHAKKHIKTGDSETSKEFCRTIELPQTIDHDHFRCNLTEDGILILDAPVKAPDYESITFDNDQHLSIRPKSETQLKSSMSSTKPEPLVPIGISEPTIMKDGARGRKLRLEVPIEKVYKAEDICVRLEANSLIISGKHTAPGSGSMSEFTRTYELPEAVDPFTVVAQLIGTTLVIEAPLLCTV